MIKIVPCSHEAANFAVMNYHYSKKMPLGKLIKYGVWEDDLFIGVVLFGRGASPKLGSAYGLDQIECCELVRVALTKHVAQVSQIVLQTIKKLKESNPGLRLIISFADPRQNHKGTIYQAMNWIYSGDSMPAKEYFFEGKWVHVRTMFHTGFQGGQTLPKIGRLSDKEKKELRVREAPGKHRYLFPLDRGIRRKIESLRLPYPAVEGSIVSRDNSVVEGQVQSLRTAPLVIP